jgi:hypothetical protein
MGYLAYDVANLTFRSSEHTCFPYPPLLLGREVFGMLNSRLGKVASGAFVATLALSVSVGTAATLTRPAAHSGVAPSKGSGLVTVPSEGGTLAAIVYRGWMDYYGLATRKAAPTARSTRARSSYTAPSVRARGRTTPRISKAVGTIPSRTIRRTLTARPRTAARPIRSSPPARARTRTTSHSAVINRLPGRRSSRATARRRPAIRTRPTRSSTARATPRST